MIKIQLRTGVLDVVGLKDVIRPLITDASEAEHHCKSSTNNTNGLSSKATHDKNVRIRRRVRSSASAGETSMFARRGNSSSGNSFSSRGIKSRRTGRSTPRAVETVYLK